MKWRVSSLQTANPNLKMCARCRNEGGGDIDFTAIPKRKKKGRPVLMSAYIPTEEEERLALETENDNNKGGSNQEATAGKMESLYCVHPIVSETDQLVRTTSIQETADVQLIPLTAATPDEAQRDPTVNSTMDETLLSNEKVACDDSILSFSENEPKSVDIILIVHCTEIGENESPPTTEHRKWTEGLLARIQCIHMTYLIVADQIEIAALQQSVQHQLSLLATNYVAHRQEGNFTANTKTGDVEETKLKTYKSIHLCCIGVGVDKAVSIWHRFPHTFHKFMIIDPPHQYSIASASAKVKTTLGAGMWNSNNQKSNQSYVDNALTSCCSWATTVRHRLPYYLMKLPMLRVTFTLIKAVANILLSRSSWRLPSLAGDKAADILHEAAVPFMKQSDPKTECDNSLLLPPYKLLYSPYYYASSTGKTHSEHSSVIAEDGRFPATVAEGVDGVNDAKALLVESFMHELFL